MEKILVIGCCGAGKTTFSKALAAKLGLPLVHLDALFWRDNWQSASKEEFDSLLHAELVKPRWIIDGNYNRTLLWRMRHADTVIFLDYPRLSSLCGVIGRYFKNRGRARADVGGDCREKLDLPFLKFVWNFNKKYRKYYRDLLGGAAGADTLILKNRRQARRFLAGEAFETANGRGKMCIFDKKT